MKTNWKDWQYLWGVLFVNYGRWWYLVPPTLIPMLGCVSRTFFCHFHVSSTKVTKNQWSNQFRNLVKEEGPINPCSEITRVGKKKAPTSPRKSQRYLNDTFQEKSPLSLFPTNRTDFQVSWFKWYLQLHLGCLKQRLCSLITALNLHLCKSECLKGPQILNCKVASLKFSHSNFPLTTLFVI